MGIKVKHRGSFNKTEKFLKNAQNIDYKSVMRSHAQKALDKLIAATPVDTGLTAKSWDYSISNKKDDYTITWSNSNSTDYGYPIVNLLVYGHATRDNHYISGHDFVTPIIDEAVYEITNDIAREMNK